MTKLPKKKDTLLEIFKIEKPLIGTIHCLPFPGSPQHENQKIEDIIDHAIGEALRYQEGGMDGIIVENEGDYPFLRPEDIGYETVSIISIITNKVREAVNIPVGINVLANGAIPSFAAAKASQASFIRVNQWVNAYIANEGFVQGDSAKALRYRKNIDSKEIKIFADVHVKHGSHSIVGDRGVSEQAGDVEFFDADVVIATGNRTGDPTSIKEIEDIKKGTYLPVIVGSGINKNNAKKILTKADGAIVGSSLKKNGNWWELVDRNKVRDLVNIIEELRSK